MPRNATLTLRTMSSRWNLTPATSARAGRRSTTSESRLLRDLASTRQIEIESEHTAEFQSRRGAAIQPLNLELDVSDEGYVIAVRHESGAVTFHAPTHSHTRRRSDTRDTASVRLGFSIPVRSIVPDGVRRSGIFRKILRVIVIKLVGKLVDAALVTLARKWEERCWKARNRGLLRVNPDSLALGAASALSSADARSIAKGPARNLLLIHGTFSNTESGFSGLARTVSSEGRRFFPAVADIYGDRIFAFNHFTVSESPEENARALVEALPASGGLFDVITHSRGALVLRTIVEMGDVLGPAASRFNVNRAILCAGPNQGTPLADGGRWDSIASWMGNITEIIPDNPFTFVVDFLAEALKWLARAATEKLPGLAAMNPAGEFIADLQDDPSPPTNAYWALAANHEPDDSLVWRAADFGIDAFFSRANDMVVPTAGSWRVDPVVPASIPSTQIACFGPGGNVRIGGSADVHHCNLFSQPESIELLIRILRGEALGIPPPEPLSEPPSLWAFRRRRASRASAAVALTGAAPASLLPAGDSPSVPTPPTGAGLHSGGPASSKTPRPSRVVPRAEVTSLTDAFGRESKFVVATEPPADENFNLFLFAPEAATEESVDYYLIASYRNARVLEKFNADEPAAVARWKRIRDIRSNIVRYIDGDPRHDALPNDDALRGLGSDLFEVLFPGDIRRLYDHARADFAKPVGAQAAERRLSIIFTSMLGWVAEKPWEFAYDPSRKVLLAVQDVNFVRNVLTAVPAEARPARVDKLRILVVAAQPIGAAPLSVDEEIAVITRGFQSLIDLQLAEVQVVPSVTPEWLHELMESSAYGNDPIDVLHFIGHGEYRLSEAMGYLLFENDQGGVQELNAQIITQIVAKRGIRLVFFNACETGMGYDQHATGSRERAKASGTFDFASGIAPALVEAGVPAVVANQFPVLDPSAAAFARHFYGSLAQGRSIGDAAREARVAVNYSISGEAIDWAIPVVFARNPHERLVVAPASLSMATTAAAARAAVSESRRRGVRRAESAVAIWDVNHVVPDLEGILRRMNHAQDYFRFQVADITAPLGTWRRLPLRTESRRRGVRSHLGDAQLHSLELIEKLRGVPAQLGVNQIICITNFALRDNEMINLEGNSDFDAGIAIVSTAGILGALRPPDTSMERLVINQTVAYVNPLGSHERGTKGCPNYFNRERLPEIMAGKIAICGPCRREFQAFDGGPHMLRALDALLALQA